MDSRELAQKIDYAFSEYVPDAEATAFGGVVFSLSRGGFEETGVRLLEDHMPSSLSLDPEEREYLRGIAGFCKWENEHTGETGYLFFRDESEMEAYWRQVLAGGETI